MEKFEAVDMLDEENELIPVAMQIIIHAGNGRTCAQEAITYAKKGDIPGAKEKLKEAKDNILLAHRSQTGVIQKEAGGHSYEPNLLFTHAQDHLMTITSEVNMTGSLIDMYELVFESCVFK